MPLCIATLPFVLFFQELRPKGMDVRQDELGDLVDKEMAATSAAIEEAVRRIDVLLMIRLSLLHLYFTKVVR